MHGFEFVDTHRITLPYPERIHTARVEALDIEAVVYGGFVRGYIKYKGAMWPIGIIFLTDSLYDLVLDFVDKGVVSVIMQHATGHKTYQATAWRVKDKEALKTMIEQVRTISHSD